MPQQRDLNMLLDDVYTVAPLWEMGQLVYLSYGWIVPCLYIQETCGESHQSCLSTSTLIIFETCFSRQNLLTTRICTKSHKTIKFSVLFRRKMTPLIELYGPIFVSEYVYILYSSEQKGGGSKVALWLKRGRQRLI